MIKKLEIAKCPMLIPISCQLPSSRTRKKKSSVMMSMRIKSQLQILIENTIEKKKYKKIKRNLLRKKYTNRDKPDARKKKKEKRKRKRRIPARATTNRNTADCGTRSNLVSPEYAQQTNIIGAVSFHTRIADIRKGRKTVTNL